MVSFCCSLFSKVQYSVVQHLIEQNLLMKDRSWKPLNEKKVSLNHNKTQIGLHTGVMYECENHWWGNKHCSDSILRDCGKVKVRDELWCDDDMRTAFQCHHDFYS
jgi:hypothetical protein